MLKIYNSLTRKKEEFHPIEDSKVKMYVCGPTVYNYFHIGNARAFLVFDAFRSYLQYRGFEVTYVQNITDIEDKIINEAKQQKVHPSTIAERYTKAFFDDLGSLGIQRADFHPKATEFVNQMIDMIKILVGKGYAYVVDNDVYIDVYKVKDYGKLSGKSLDALRAGARVELNEKKRSPLDFALWKKAKSDEPSWESPWGRGRPGWHTECAVMAHHYLGMPFDIHAGGSDLIFPHHENEIAQAESAYEKQFARYWMHNGFLNIEGEKMSKSLGNFLLAREIRKKYSKDAIRLFFLSKNYRSPMDFSIELIEEAERAINNMKDAFNIVRYEVGMVNSDFIESDKTLGSLKSSFIEALDDDFNTPAAISVMFEISKSIKRIISQDKLTEADRERALQYAELLYQLGDSLRFFEEYKSSPQKLDQFSQDLLHLLIEVRNILRAQKKWEIADLIRNKLQEHGIELIDKKDETDWKIR
ncbi:MAG: cysteine--tRNA ligase [Candidatus Cloacimonadia bacterium]